ncbi:Hypothetical predicted protein [Drosophila guanche]|nr:Hypothetical predicted protein [Drosophila guanche]
MHLGARYYNRLSEKLSFYRRRNPSLCMKYLEDRQEMGDTIVRLMMQGLELEELQRLPRLDEPLNIYDRYLFLKQQLIEVEQQLRAGHVEIIGQGPEELVAENYCDNSSNASDSDSDCDSD